ncbi:SDR family NAD(P)-dependent oxidoreductase [Chondromyces apiculatus]|uniref:3-oxoacyl-[acyl-carrier protein] reductase n=1 Tax=Chondromyces apiculatus DSM 436 TaxID=1192034 RepID=A0A017TE26_9BACT|nr:SDR family NAD(P)-dependent oxidoreductase [Chondromyces apiculatus]EYF06876.1 3-oxoacyl-[acyl-carrier protein] reductase [Chondromyces apiculatus DSM 436]
MNQPLTNKLALVTGSSRGIGAAIAARLAADGASVIVNYAASPQRAAAVVDAIRKDGGAAEAVQADVSTAEGRKALIAASDQAFGGKFDGRLDILVNNAGTVEFGPFLEAKEGAYERHFDLNVRAVMELSHEAAKRMSKVGWGRIINIGSAFGEGVPLPGVAIYVGSKFAVNGFTRALSRELGALGITVNGVQPGPVNTEMSPEDGPHAPLMISRTSVGRFGRVHEIAHAVAFLAHPHAAFVNGENINVDGGWLA